MRSLTLLRHAKSSWGDESLDDFHRPLSERGERAANAMGKHLAAEEATFDLIVASPAQRVRETLEGLADGGWKSGPVRLDPAIYQASASGLLVIVRATANDVQRLLLVGHNPAFGMLALQLAEDDEDGLRAALAAKYPTGALAEIALDIESWGEAGPACGRLTAFIPPKSLPGA